MSAAFLLRAQAAAALAGLSGDVVVRVDDPPLDASAFSGPPEGVVAVMVSSTSAAGLLRAELPSVAGEDAFARAATWAAGVRALRLAPPVSPSRLRAIVTAAESAGWTLVEPDVPHDRLKTPRSPVERAVLWTVATGAIARPLLFVRTARAPKGGLAKVRPAQALEGTVSLRVPTEISTPANLAEAALVVLSQRGCAMAGAELLREARDLWAHRERARGRRAVASAEDGKVLAKALLQAWMAGEVDLYGRGEIG
jgi:hypothetical protein